MHHQKLFRKFWYFNEDVIARIKRVDNNHQGLKEGKKEGRKERRKNEMENVFLQIFNEKCGLKSMIQYLKYMEDRFLQIFPESCRLNST